MRQWATAQGHMWCRKGRQLSHALRGSAAPCAAHVHGALRSLACQPHARAAKSRSQEGSPSPRSLPKRLPHDASRILVPMHSAQSGARFMWRACNVNVGVRLALVEPGAANALIFESAHGGAAPPRRERAASASALPPATPCFATAALPLQALADISVRELPLQNTLLASAVSRCRALNASPHPERVQLTHGDQACYARVCLGAACAAQPTSRAAGRVLLPTLHPALRI